MNPSPPGGSEGTAWQPFTFGGVAAFATAGALRAWGVVILTAMLLGLAADRYFVAAWFPALDLALERLPASGEIRDGRLLWPSPQAVELANNGFVRLLVNPNFGPVAGQSADVTFECTADTLTAQSLFGYWVMPYPYRLHLALNQPTLQPLWAAWRPHFRLGLPTAFVVAMILAWAGWALVLAPLARALALLLRREVPLRGCWKAAFATFAPFALATALGLVLYAGRGFRLPDLLVTWALAHLYSLILLFGAIPCLPRLVRASPFVVRPSPITGATSPFATPPGDPNLNSEPDPSSARGDVPETPSAPSVLGSGEPPADPRNPFAVPTVLPAPPVPPPREPFAAPALPSRARPSDRPEPPAPEPPPRRIKPPTAPAPTPHRSEPAEPLDPLNPS
ncbi:MAG: hypothetical protein HS113_12305 [Verrucomicrobiales bacterium]|nr:hypothetical protein [Verrucomicrobiales bacterium]